MKSRVTSHLLTKENDSIILGRGNDNGQYVNKRAINKLQQVPWTINEDILHLLSDTLKPSDTPLSAIEERDRKKSHILRDRETNTVIDYLLENGNKFYFGWKYDKRGRLYSQGYHINPQGNEYRKAMLSFANKETLTSEGIQYLKIDIANTMGYDKLTWFQRIAKANGVIADVFNNTNPDWESHIETLSTFADSPLLFIKAMYAYHEGVILGNPIGHNMGLDGTASGIQFMSALSGCVTSAQNSNVHAKIVRTYTDEAQAQLDALEEELAQLQ